MVNLYPIDITQILQGKKQTLHYLKIAKMERMDFEQVCKLIAKRSTLTEDEVEFALGEVRTVIIDNLKMGRGTELGPLGSVEISVEAASKPSEEELDQSTIKRMKLIFKPSAKIKQALKNVRYTIKRK